MNKINVCHIMSALEAGGVETVVYNYCSNMDLNSYNMHILHQRKASEKNINEFSRLGFSINEIPEKAKNPIKNYQMTKKYLKNNSIDVVHAHMTLVNFIPLMAAKRLGIKVRISHSHNSDVRKKNLLKKIFEFIMKKLTCHYATINLACGVEAGKYLYGNKKYYVLNNALELKKYSYNEKIKKELADKHDIKKNDFVIGNIGRFTCQKNQMFLLEIFEEVLKNNKNCKLIIIGDGELKECLKNKAKELKILDKVIFTGIVNNTNEYYSLFDLFVLPSLWEGLPVVGLEAQANGLKCLFSDNIDHRAIIEKENVELLPLMKEIWVEKILSMKKDYERIIDSSNFEEKGFEINNEVKKLESIYNGGIIK